MKWHTHSIGIEIIEVAARDFAQLSYWNDPPFGDCSAAS